MPRGPAPGWRQRKEPVTDDYILAAVTKSGGLGKHDANGHYATLVIKGLADRVSVLIFRFNADHPQSTPGEMKGGCHSGQTTPQHRHINLREVVHHQMDVPTFSCIAHRR